MGYGSSLQQKLYYRAPAFVKNGIASIYGRREKRRRCGRYYDRYFRLAEEAQWWPTARAEESCFESTKAFLIHAQEQSDYYQALFAESGFDPRRLSNLGELAALPLLPKETLRSQMSRIIARNTNPKEVRWNHTSGTTGLGLRFPETWECFEREYAYRFNNYAQAGIHAGDRWAFCAGHPVAEPGRTRPPFWVHDYSNNWLLMSSSHLTEKNLESYIAKLERFKPALIGGYPSSVYLLALANEQLGRPVRPTAVFTASETLFPFQKQAIEASFGCPALSYYGNAERCGFISECEKGLFHIRAEHSYVELLNEDGGPARPGESGRIVCTGFGNPAAPMIRYDVGDVGILSEKTSCECGRGGVLLECLVGRTEDYIVTPDGRFVGRLDHLFKDAARVRIAQLYQEAPDRLIIRVERELGYGPADEAAILAEARLRLGADIAIYFDYESGVERSKTAKFRFVISKVPGKNIFGKNVAAAPL